MDDCIKRKELLDDVRNTMFTMSMCVTMDELHGMRLAQQIIAKKIETYPAANVVEVVRCGECNYSAVDYEGQRYCKLVTYYNHVPDDWFCADGEKRADNG